MARAAVGASTARAAIDSDDRAAGEDDRVAREQAAVEQQIAIQAAYEARAQVADLDAQLSPHQPEPPKPEFAEDVADKLAQLAELHKASIINDDEFAAAKAKLLA